MLIFTLILKRSKCIDIFVNEQLKNASVFDSSITPKKVNMYLYAYYIFF